jgi:hypothetical protein
MKCDSAQASRPIEIFQTVDPVASPTVYGFGSCALCSGVWTSRPSAAGALLKEGCVNYDQLGFVWGRLLLFRAIRPGFLWLHLFHRPLNGEQFFSNLLDLVD